MERPTLAEAITAWTAEYEGLPREEIDRRIWLQAKVIQALSEGRPLSAEKFATTTGLPLEHVPNIFKKLEANGLEFDGNGSLIGAALTLSATPHRFHVHGRDLYAWCSLDTLFLPALLGETAEVESDCPVSGEKIRLTVAPGGVQRYSPSSTVLSIVLPGLSCTPDRTGPQSSMCSQMYFFGSRDAAKTWLKDRPGIAILTVEEAYQLARVHWVDRKERAFRGDQGARRRTG